MSLTGQIRTRKTTATPTTRGQVKTKSSLSLMGVHNPSEALSLANLNVFQLFSDAILLPSNSKDLIVLISPPKDNAMCTASVVTESYLG